ncbi:MAG: hypothetical protein H0W46_09915, partial [Acidimicrobiia bacterium]|nr:hypothetical protein [Acidimicrobiia bacterium]
FGLLSPIMLLANWVEERRTRRRDRLGATRANAAASESLRTAAREHHAADLTRARHAQPTVAEAVAVVARGDPCLWERRPDHLDAYAATVATGKRPWRPPVVSSPRAVPGAAEILRAVGPLAGVPISADLRAGGIGVAGDAEAARAAARGILMNTVTLHGPADLDVLVCTSPENPQAWEWAKWLPHSRIHGPPGVLASTQNARAWSAAVGSENTTAADRSTPRRLTLVVADGERWWRDRDAPLRHLLGAANVAVLAIAGEADRLPATCATVLTLDCDGAATLETAADGAGSTDVIAPLLDVELATVTARRMARLDDPERPVRSATAIPDHVSILDVLDLPRPTADGIRARWFGRADTASLSVPIGVDADGPIVVDLVADGPHGLVAGTTGSGKSELLRTIVLALASTVSPDELNVALIDFKGGAAFDACADLPHTVSLVTDLDEHLAARLLRSLGAELTRREQVLRDAGASTIGDLTGGPISLPRLLLVVDEFALLAAELPAFVPSLVDIAQRGRSLGLHLLLATQRPAGIVDNKIRANTNLRIALRVQDDSDSVDVVGTRDAAALPRRTPGRAVARLGAGELIILQTAWSSGVRQSGPGRGVVVRPFVANRAPTTLERRLRRAPVTPPVAAGATTDIVRLARAIDKAAAEVGQQHQRRPYVDPLPAVVPLDELLAAHRPGGSGGVPLALADRPDQQCHEVRCWHPGPRGSLAIHGIAGAGTSTALVTLALALAACHPPEDTHLYVIDADANLLAPLDALPHTGAVVGLDDPSRLDRLFRHLTGELTRRRRLAGELGGPAAVAAQEPTIVLLVDNVGALRQAAESEPALGEVWAALELVVRDGRPLGVCVVLTAAHERALPATLAAAIPDRLVMRAADRHAYTAFGIRPSDVPTMGPGRALDPSGPVEMQIAAPPTDLLAAVAALAAAHGDDGVGAAASRQPRRIEPLPDRATLQPLLALATRRDGVL